MNRSKNKVAVINRINFKNYGSVLQCYALCEAISNFGFDSEILWESGSESGNFDFRPRKIVKIIFSLLRRPSLLRGVLDMARGVQRKQISAQTIALFESFIHNNANKRYVSHKKLVELAKSEDYVKFVCGSDQVWCSTTSYVDPLMYLRFAPKDKRVAYAPSIGRNYIPKYNEKIMRKYIRDIPHISIREDEGQKLLQKLIQETVPVVADPTLLLSCAHYQKLQSDIKMDCKYILTYFLDSPSEIMQRSIKKLANEKSKRVISIGCELPLLKEDENYEQPDCGPAEFLGYISGATVVVTDSYHGILFSLIYSKDFYSVERNYGEFDQSSRQLTVLRKVDLSQRYVRRNDKVDFALGKIDYSDVKKKMEVFTAESLEYLKLALND